MKILLTGEPKSGKSTLLAECIEHLVIDKQGFLTRELTENGERVAFELIASSGKTARLASVDSNSTIRVSRYGVEIDNFDNFLNDFEEISTDVLLYIDEIGQMQLYSETFKDVAEKFLNSSNLLLGTISKVYTDDFIKEVLKRDDVVLIEVDINSRDKVRNVLNGLSQNAARFQQLNIQLQDKITHIAKDYARDGAYIQLGKLFRNTIKYLADDRVEKLKEDAFRVKGNSDTHLVRHTTGSFDCDCNLFNGRGNFFGHAGECSHVQSVKIMYF